MSLSVTASGDIAPVDPIASSPPLESEEVIDLSDTGSISDTEAASSQVIDLSKTFDAALSEVIELSKTFDAAQYYHRFGDQINQAVHTVASIIDTPIPTVKDFCASIQELDKSHSSDSILHRVIKDGISPACDWVDNFKPPSSIEVAQKAADQGAILAFALVVYKVLSEIIFSITGRPAKKHRVIASKVGMAIVIALLIIANLLNVSPLGSIPDMH